MLKSYAICLHEAVAGILLDACDTFPSNRQSLNRDLSRFSSLTKTRGLPVFTLDLPALGKHFDKCLSEGKYTKPDLPLSGTINPSTPIPRLFSGLMLLVFAKDGMLLERPCINAIAFLRQLYAIGKKVRVDCEERRVYETLDSFYTVDQLLPSPRLSWRKTSEATISQYYDALHCKHYSTSRMLRCKLERRHASSCVEVPGASRKGDIGRILERRVLDICQKVADIMSNSLGFFDPYRYPPKHGPGAVSDLKGGAYKYAFPQWSDRLEVAFPQSDFAFANHSCWASHGGLIETRSPSSKLICVPKTQKGPRLIAAEPSAHQWCEQIIWRYFDEGVRNCWIGKSIHFRDQTHNQQFALSASRTQSHWTVDLSAASDRVTCRMVESMFRSRPELLQALIAVRTPLITQDITSVHPKCHTLNKYTTMGSACTFPVESLIFLMIALSSVIFSRGLEPSYRNLVDIAEEVRVFGDDIIIPADSGEVLELLLHHFSFEVNHAKTHRNGRFRESCGMEAYDGYDVTPSYILQVPRAASPESIVSAVECSNNFYRRGWWRTSAVLMAAVGNRDIPVVLDNSGFFGYVTYLEPPRPQRVRWNKDLQRWEGSLVQNRTTVPKVPAQGDAVLLQYFVEDPDQDLPWSSGVNGRPRTKLRRGWEDISAWPKKVMWELAPKG